jgi:hypothetical protein
MEIKAINGKLAVQCSQPSSWLKSFVLVSCLLFGSQPVAADGRCLKSERAVNVGGQTEQVREYLCRGQSSAPSVKVSFYRLSEVIAGSLAETGDASWVEPILGKVRLIETPAFMELKALTKAFGNTNEHSEAALIFGISVPGGKPPSERKPLSENSDRQRKVVTFRTPWADGDWSFDFPLPHFSNSILKSTAFPTEFSQRYRENCDEPAVKAINCMILWKYLTRREVERFGEYWRLENKNAGQGGDQSGPYEPHARYMKLMLHLTRGGWPEDLLMVDSPSMLDVHEGGLGLDAARLVCDDHLHMTGRSSHVCPSCGKERCRACHPRVCPRCRSTSARPLQ